MSELQTRLDRIERWDTFSIDWQYFRELAALQAMDLCALSVGLHPEYARLIDEMLSVDLRAPPTAQELKQMAEFQNKRFTECERRFRIVMNHVVARDLTTIDAKRAIINIAEFTDFAKARGWSLPGAFTAALDAPQAAAPKPAPKAAPVWPALAQQRAREILKEHKARSLYPPQIRIAEMIADEFRRDGVMGTGGKPLSGTTIKRHAFKGISSAQDRQLSTAPRRGK